MTAFDILGTKEGDSEDEESQDENVRRALGEARSLALQLKVPLLRDAQLATYVEYFCDLLKNFPKDSGDVPTAKSVVTEGTKQLDRASRDATLAKWYTQTIPSLVDLVGEVAAQRKVLKAACFAYESFAKTKAFPSTIPPDLVDMRDPFGDNLRYQRTDDGFVVYSVGRDRQDNNGASRSFGGAFDLVYRTPAPHSGGAGNPFAGKTAPYAPRK